MADIKQIKTKIGSTQSIQKITGAMEIISTLKFQKMKKSAEDLREYMNSILWIISSVNAYVDLFAQPHPEAKRELAILISTEKGLCGSLNTMLFKAFDEHYKNDKSDLDVFVVGKKAVEYCRHHGYKVVGSMHLKDEIASRDLGALYDFIESSLQSDMYRSIRLWYNFFQNTMKQVPAWFQLFPLSATSFESFMAQLEIEIPQANTDDLRKDMVLEPNRHQLLGSMQDMLMNVVIYGAVLHNKTWEHAARMLAMKAAKDNAIEIVEDLTLNYNKARQDAITQEVLEIVSAKAVLDD